MTLRAHLDLAALTGSAGATGAGNWGYTHRDGRRFALTGTSLGTSIVEVTDPRSPRSVGFVLTYGSFDFFDAGDLTWNTEAQLVCPNASLAKVEVYQVTHHGADTSNHPLVLEALAPTVAVMNNGPRKGGAASTVKALKALPSLKALYQLHRNVATGPDDNTTPDLVANPDEAPDAGHMVSAHVKGDGAYDVVNHRTGQRRTFSSEP